MSRVYKIRNHGLYVLVDHLLVRQHYTGLRTTVCPQKILILSRLINQAPQSFFPGELVLSESHEV